jgi:uncharacterized protein
MSLANETSPYLLQHAKNPVEWFPWGEAAFEKARKEDKPILVSIGYAACHWCHVMEHESFEDEATAKFMNTYFVNIKVDREERPDVDHIYMNACQLLTGAGGWPLNMFLTPELLPFSGGTYFPPKPGYGKPSWMDVLMYMKNVFTNERDKVEEQAQLIKTHLIKMDNAFVDQLVLPEGKLIISKSDIQTAVQTMQHNFDSENGGFGGAPKFPGSMSLMMLLKYYYYEQDATILNHVTLSLDKMMLGGIFDQIGGGFARYTVDAQWMIPHFEKMLYDNALLVSLYAEAFRITGNDDYKQVIEKTLRFVERELMHPEGGFYASYDADSEGVEGKYYTFTVDEIKSVLGDETEFASTVYNLTAAGNWEHTNILFRNKTNTVAAVAMGLDVNTFNNKLDRVNQLLFEYRNNRIKPGLDDKIILSWNAMMCCAYVQAFKALGDEHYKQIVVAQLDFLLSAFNDTANEGALLHTYKNGVAKYPAFIEDYALMIQLLLDVYEITSDSNYLNKAIQYSTFVETQFMGADGLYYYTLKSQHDVPYRSKDFYDNATPSGNSVMANNVLRLSILTGEENYRQQAEKMLLLIKTNMLKHGTSFGNWLCAALQITYPVAEVGITGKAAFELRDAIFKIYYPQLIVMCDAAGNQTYPLVAGRYEASKNQIFLCRNNSCNLPVTTVQDFEQMLNKF